MWCILRIVDHKERKQYEVLCKCGYTGIRRIDHILSGRTKYCKSCASKNTSIKYPPPIIRKNCGLISGTYWGHIKNGAAKREIKIEITKEYAWSLFEKQKGLCALSGVPIVLTLQIVNQTTDWSNTTASLDRIDSDIGYIEGNVQWVHKEVNYIKRDLMETDFINWCKLIANNTIKGGSCGE